MSDPDRRPLSPHLQIYKPQITSVLSALHRLCGIALAAGLVYLVGWFLAAAAGPESFAAAAAIANSLPGAFVLFAVTGAFFFHACNGIRHLVWDAGHGFDLSAVTVSGWLVLAAAAASTLALWGWALLA